MHELQITQSILAVVLRHAKAAGAGHVISIRLSVGELSDLESEWIQKYFDRISKGTIAEKATLQIDRTPVLARCDQCGHTFGLDSKRIDRAQCPECGHGQFVIVAGREYKVEDMKVVSQNG